jgi:hypothetical protein
VSDNADDLHVRRKCLQLWSFSLFANKKPSHNVQGLSFRGPGRSTSVMGGVGNVWCSKGNAAFAFGLQPSLCEGNGTVRFGSTHPGEVEAGRIGAATCRCVEVDTECRSDETECAWKCRQCFEGLALTQRGSSGTVSLHAMLGIEEDRLGFQSSQKFPSFETKPPFVWHRPWH